MAADGSNTRQAGNLLTVGVLPTDTCRRPAGRWRLDFQPLAYSGKSADVWYAGRRLDVDRLSRLPLGSRNNSGTAMPPHRAWRQREGHAATEKRCASHYNRYTCKRASRASSSSTSLGIFFVRISHPPAVTRTSSSMRTPTPANCGGMSAVSGRI